MTKYAEIPLDQLVVSRCNVRRHVDPETIKKLAEDIRRNGLHEPLIVREEDGKYGVYIGGRRLRAIRMIRERWPEDFKKNFPEGKIPCILKQVDDKDAILASLSENYHKASLTQDEYGYAIDRLKELGVSEREIEERVRMSLDEIERALNIWRAIRELEERSKIVLAKPGRPPEKKKPEKKKIPRKAIAIGRIVARRLSRKGLVREPEEFTKTFVKKVAEEGLSTKEVERLAKKLTEEAEKTRNASIALEKAIKELKKVETVERVILLRRDVVDAVTLYARKKGIHFDDAINNLLIAELRRRGLLHVA